MIINIIPLVSSSAMMVLKSLFVPSCTNNQYCPRAAQSRNVHKSGAAAGSPGRDQGGPRQGWTRQVAGAQPSTESPAPLVASWQTD